MIFTAPVQLSVAVTLGTGGMAWSHSIVKLLRVVVNIGAILSFTVIVCTHVAEFPQISVARYVLVIVYLLVQIWLLVTSLTNALVIVPVQLSVAVIWFMSGVGTFDAQVKFRFAGQDIVGAILSLTVMI